MSLVAANCCLSYWCCCSVAITTIPMVMSSAHESIATPVYEYQGKTNQHVGPSVDKRTQKKQHHTHDPVNMNTHTHEQQTVQCIEEEFRCKKHDGFRWRADTENRDTD